MPRSSGTRRSTRSTCYEAELAALEAARTNVPDPRAGFHWTDVTGLGAGGEPYDAVIMNPPFHQGRAAEPDLGAGFIAAAARILKPHGRLVMVANRQLPYEAALDAAFRRWTRLEEAGGYKLLEAEGPRRRGPAAERPIAAAGAGGYGGARRGRP